MRKTHLRVLSYNIHKGFSVGNAAYILDHLRKALRKIDPDIVCLQEVLGEHTGHRRRIPEWPIASQFEYLADSIWPHHAYGKNSVYQHGHHGNAILSKFPVTEWDNIDISQNRLERRGILHAVIAMPRQSLPLHVLSLHLDLLERTRKPQLLKICNRIGTHVPDEHPLIIGGDFNDWRGRATSIMEQGIGASEAFQSAHGAHARSFPARYPLLKLDRFYFRGLELQKASVLKGDPWNALSDHLPLLCEFLLTP